MYNEVETVSDFGDSANMETFIKYKHLNTRTEIAMRQSETLREKADKLRLCGCRLVTDTTGKKVFEANFCRERLCPMCQKRKSLQQYATALQIADILTSEYNFVHCVLTVANCSSSELEATINRLYKASSKLFNLPRVKQGFKGVARHFEVTYNKRTKEFHPHLHCLCAVKPSYFTSRYYLSVELLRELWKEALQVDYLPQVSVTKCDENGFAEVSKYCVKPLDLTLTPTEHAKVLDTLNIALKSRRLVQYYGILRDVHGALRNDDGTDGPLRLTEVELAFWYYNFATENYENER